jgi:hypothetical protein
MFWGILVGKHFLSLSSSTVKAYMEMFHIPASRLVKAISFEQNNALRLARILRLAAYASSVLARQVKRLKKTHAIIVE